MVRNKKDVSFVNAANRVMKIKRRQSRYGKQINAIWELFSEYSEVSTIHGIRYMGEKRRHCIERVWWAAMILLSMVLSATFIYQTWDKWRNTPVIVTFAEKSTPVYSIPFPAVTICTDVKNKQTVLNFTHIYRSTKFKNFMPSYKNDYKNISDEMMQLASSVSQVCYPGGGFTALGDNQYTARNVYNDLMKVSPRLNETIISCKWQGKSTRCTKLFKEMLTDEGICFTFNFLNASDIYRVKRLDPKFPVLVHNKTDTFSKKESIDNETDVFPARVFTSGEGLDLMLKLNDKDLDLGCAGPVQSFKILLHTPSEVPQMSKYFYRLPLNHDIVMSVRPNIMNTAPNLVDYNKHRRKCLFEQENPLFSFKKYTQRNCRLECLTLRMLRRCQCVKFSMPRLNGTLVCGLKKLKCVKSVENDYIAEILHHRAIACECFPACNSIMYDAEMSMAKFDYYSYRDAITLNRTQKKGNFVRIFMSFKDEQFFTSRRSALYGVTDFIASIGGILGLFMGISVLSVAEIIYFTTLRLGCNLRRRRLVKKERTLIQKEFDKLDPVDEAPKSVSSLISTNDKGSNSSEQFTQNRF